MPESLRPPTQFPSENRLMRGDFLQCYRIHQTHIERGDTASQYDGERGFGGVAQTGLDTKGSRLPFSIDQRRYLYESLASQQVIIYH